MTVTSLRAHRRRRVRDPEQACALVDHGAARGATEADAVRRSAVDLEAHLTLRAGFGGTTTTCGCAFGPCLPRIVALSVTTPEGLLVSWTLFTGPWAPVLSR